MPDKSPNTGEGAKVLMEAAVQYCGLKKGRPGLLVTGPLQTLSPDSFTSQISFLQLSAQSHFLGQADGYTGKGTYHSRCWPQFNPQGQHGEKRGGLGLERWLSS